MTKISDLKKAIRIVMQNQIRFVIAVENRDRPKRLGMTVLMVSILLTMGLRSFIIFYLIAVAIAELSWILLKRHLPPENSEISLSYYLAVGISGWFAVITYLSPAFALATLPSSAMLALALMWLFGVYMHLSNTFSAFPIHNWTLMTPAYGCSFVLFWLASQNPALPTGQHHWLIVSALMFIYILNFVETISTQKSTRQALRAAEQAASERLSALEHMSRHDGLTGLLNRGAFDTSLTSMLERNRAHSDVAVLMIDLDGFKPINDTYSHEAGDIVLQTIAERLTMMVRESGVAARLGGDEFAIALRSTRSTKDAMRIAQYVSAELGKPVNYGETKLHVGASIGVARASDVERTVEAICAAADQAMYRAKTSSEHSTFLFQPESFPRKLTLDDRDRIIEAMSEGAIQPFYQPKVDIVTGDTCGFEALARWITPDGKQRRPGAFLPAINELRLDMHLLRCITNRVLSDVQGLLDHGFDPGEVSINVPEVALATVSGRQELDNLLNKYPLAREHITLEITEDVFIARAADAILESIKHFRSSGLRVSLDDFGTGFASFKHLQNLDFDEIKVDTSFVREIENNEASRVLVVGFAYLAAGLGVSIVAEGVETDEQRKFLEKVGYRVVQGYYYAQALPFDEIVSRLETERSKPEIEHDASTIVNLA